MAIVVLRGGWTRLRCLFYAFHALKLSRWLWAWCELCMSVAPRIVLSVTILPVLFGAERATMWRDDKAFCRRQLLELQLGSIIGGNGFGCLRREAIAKAGLWFRFRLLRRGRDWR
jgi:hypothetical protein